MVQNVSPKILIINATAVNKVVTLSILIQSGSALTQGEVLGLVIDYKPSGVIYFALNTTNETRNLYINYNGAIASTSNCVATTSNTTGSVTFISAI